MLFNDLIKTRTDQAHAQAESAPFISALMGGQLNSQAYNDYLAAFLPIYRRMESILRDRTDSILLSYFNHRALDRTQLIENDIAHLNSKTASTLKGEDFASVQKYLSRLSDQVSDVRLAAHHYIRYLGDLSGGQAISKLVSRHYKISSEALTFYDFSSIGDIVFYKKRYRDLLNLAPLSAEEKDDFLDEVTNLYRLSTDIFFDLGKVHAVTQR